MPDILLTLWIIATFILLITEFTKVTGDFFPFVGGGVGAIVCFLLGFGPVIQVVVFAVISAVLWFTARPVFQRRQRDLVAKPAIDPDAHIGEKVLVTGKIDDCGWGRIALGDTEYRARSENPAEKYNVADHVKIVGVDGQWVIVRK